MKALVLAIKKIITVIVAVLVPSSTATPIVSHSIATENARAAVVAPQEEKEEPQIEIVEETEAEEAAPQEEAQSEAAEEPEVRYEAVQTWDVSATEDDSVTMTFYDTEDVEGLLDQLAGRITALFTPITAYAAERMEDGNLVVEDGEATMVVNNYNLDDEDLATIGDDEFSGGSGISDLTIEELKAMPGTVVVSGNGAMMDYVYNYFMSADAYVATVKALFQEYYGIDVEAEYPEGLQDVVAIDAVAKWRIVGTDEYAEINSAMRAEINPADMLKYSPTAIIIEGNITKIADYSFALCGDVQRVVLPEGLKEIGEYAFAYCNKLETINLPETLEVIGANAFYYCTALESVTIPESVEYIGEEAFYYVAPNAVVQNFEGIEINDDSIYLKSAN